MSWSPFAVFKTIDNVIDLASEAVEDVDKFNELKAAAEELKQSVYMKELNTKTVPWVDALHKMGRQLMGYANLGVGAYLLSTHPEIDALALGAIVAPSSIYTYIKGRGK